MTCERAWPEASSLREKNTPPRWISSCASCRFWHTTSGITARAAGAGSTAAAVGELGSGVAVTTGAGAAAAIGAEALGAATVSPDLLAAPAANATITNTAPTAHTHFFLKNES